VNKAGIILSRPTEYPIETYNDATEILTYWRTIHYFPINTFQATLRSKLTHLGFHNAIVAQRMKRAVSIVNKLQRYPNMKLSTMQDIAGLRAVVNTVEQVRRLTENYHKSEFRHVLLNEMDYISKPAKSGYRGVHLIYQYKNPSAVEADNLRIEVQIRSKLQHTWATAVETMGTFLNHSLKSSEGPSEWLDYFACVSAGFAFLERTPLPGEFCKTPPLDLLRQIVDLSFELDVSKKLRAFTVAAERISLNPRSGKYHLLKLNMDKRVVSINHYTRKEYAKANTDYTSIEREINSGAPLQAVLVSTDSISSLRKAYPNYFLDSREYLEKLNQIFKMYMRKK
jgi:ppGpp synthetase/RelA/SpoT-type nucleotidyltranferase